MSNAAMLGGILFGVAVSRAGTYPRWTGVLMILPPPFVPIVFMSGLPFVGTSIAHALLGVAVLAMGSFVLTGRTRAETERMA